MGNQVVLYLAGAGIVYTIYLIIREIWRDNDEQVND